MYEEVHEFCHQWNNDQDSFSPGRSTLGGGGAVRNLTGSLELVTEHHPHTSAGIADYLPALTMEELTSLHSPETDPLLYAEEDQQQQLLQPQQQQLDLGTGDSWTDCLQLDSDLPDWMETDTLTALQFPSLYTL